MGGSRQRHQIAASVVNELVSKAPVSFVAVGERWRRFPPMTCGLWLASSSKAGVARRPFGSDGGKGPGVVAPDAGLKGASPSLLVLCGPSGVGKGTLCDLLLSDDHLGPHFSFSVSHTSRTPRTGEVDGVHYHFVDEHIFSEMVRRGEFLEYTHAPHGVWYGTSLAELQRLTSLGKVALLDVDLDGVRSIRNAGSVANVYEEARAAGNAEAPPRSAIDVRCVGILPPSLDSLERRLRSRGTENDEQILKRLTRAGEEIDAIREEDNLVDARIINENSWQVGFPLLAQTILGFWPALGVRST